MKPVTDFLLAKQMQTKEKMNSGQSVFDPLMNTTDPAIPESIVSV